MQLALLLHLSNKFQASTRIMNTTLCRILVLSTALFECQVPLLWGLRKKSFFAHMYTRHLNSSARLRKAAQGCAMLHKGVRRCASSCRTLEGVFMIIHGCAKLSTVQSCTLHADCHTPYRLSHSMQIVHFNADCTPRGFPSCAAPAVQVMPC